MPYGTNEVFGYDYPWAVATIGGTTTSDATWVVSSQTPVTFPAANYTGTPPTQFHIADPVQPSETIAVLYTGANGTFIVARGAENTAAVAHQANFVVKQVVTGVSGYGSFYQLANTASQSVTTIGSTTTNTPIAYAYVNASGTQQGANAGAAYRLQAFGSFSNNIAADGTATITVYWGGTGGTALASMITGAWQATNMAATATNQPVAIEATVTIQAGNAASAAIVAIWHNTAGAAGTSGTLAPAQAVSVGPQTTINGTSSGVNELCLAWKWGVATTLNTASFWGVGYPIQ